MAHVRWGGYVNYSRGLACILIARGFACLVAMHLAVGSPSNMEADFCIEDLDEMLAKIGKP